MKCSRLLLIGCRRRRLNILTLVSLQLFTSSVCKAFDISSLQPLQYHSHHRKTGGDNRYSHQRYARYDLRQARYGVRLRSSIIDDTSSTTTQRIEEDTSQRGLLSLTLQELSNKLDGSGRAAVVWDCLRSGIDPNLYYNNNNQDDMDNHSTVAVDDIPIIEAWLDATSSSIKLDDALSRMSSQDDEHSILGRRQGQGLGAASWKRLQKLMHNNNGEEVHDEAIYTIENTIASLSHMKVSPDGTTKLLLKMNKDGLEVESVIIPWVDKGFSTLCVSSQVGCRQGCTFCATGRMGKLRSLTADEIIVQVYYASKVCRVVDSLIKTSGVQTNNNQQCLLPKVDNIVFMGMGEPADNAAAVVTVANTLADRRMFGLAQSKITISTVAPDPLAFTTLGQAPAVLAWSVHAVDDKLRRSVVPTTKNTMDELRTGLVQALSSRSNKLRRTMLEVALIENVNDSDDDAQRLAVFAQSIMNDVARSKVVVNVIPYNAIDHPTYKTPSMESVLRFQKIITDEDILCYIRTTRGDEESAACGQLATSKKKKKKETR